MTKGGVLDWIRDQIKEHPVETEQVSDALIRKSGIRGIPAEVLDFLVPDVIVHVLDALIPDDDGDDAAAASA